MQFFDQSPPIELAPIVKSYWQIENIDSDTIVRDKIVPDGYPELIFHYGDPYKTNISGHWELQDRLLLAGQLKNYFYLENTGAVGMFAIKLQPWAPAILFNLDMKNLQDKVLSMKGVNHPLIDQLRKNLINSKDFHQNCELVNRWLNTNCQLRDFEGLYVNAVKFILESKGKTTIADLLEKFSIKRNALLSGISVKT